jgi:hypothetical protein
MLSAMVGSIASFALDAGPKLNIYSIALLQYLEIESLIMPKLRKTIIWQDF